MDVMGKLDPMKIRNVIIIESLSCIKENPIVKHNNYGAHNYDK